MSIGDDSDITNNPACTGGPHMKIDDTSNFTELLDSTEMWNYGKELWCNLPGRYVALVADYQGAG